MGLTLIGSGSALTGVGSANVVSSGSLVDFGGLTAGISLMGLGTIGIGFSIGLTGFLVGSGVGIGLTTGGTDEGLTTRGSRS